MQERRADSSSWCGERLLRTVLAWVSHGPIQPPPRRVTAHHATHPKPAIGCCYRLYLAKGNTGTAFRGQDWDLTPFPRRMIALSKCPIISVIGIIPAHALSLIVSFLCEITVEPFYLAPPSLFLDKASSSPIVGLTKLLRDKSRSF